LPTTIEIVKALLNNYVVEFREDGRVYIVQIDRKDRRFVVITRYDKSKNTKLVYRARLRFKNIDKLKEKAVKIRIHVTGEAGVA
jgi:hypothetical protein